LAFWHVEGEEANGDGIHAKSYVNHAEARVACLLLHALLSRYRAFRQQNFRKKVAPLEVGVITFYAGQTALLQRRVH
jgi:superfamily I DNA and/or RNA helicase